MVLSCLYMSFMAIAASDSLPTSSYPPTASACCTCEPPFFSIGASTTSGQQNVVRILYHSGGHRPVRLIIAPFVHPSSPAQDDPVVAQLVVDISETMETKMESIRCYATQFPPAKAMTLEGIRAINTAEGLAAGCLAAEVFLSPRPIRTQDLMQTLFGERAKG